MFTAWHSPYSIARFLGSPGRSLAHYLPLRAGAAASATAPTNSHHPGNVVIEILSMALIEYYSPSEHTFGAG